MEGLGLSRLASIPCTDAGSSVILMGSVWVSDPGGSFGVPGSSDYYLHASLGRGIPEDSLRCHSFARVKFFCVAISKCSSTRFFQFLGTVPFLI